MAKKISGGDKINDTTLHELLVMMDARLKHIEDISADNRAIIVKLVKQSNQIVEYLKSRRGKGIQEEDENIEKRYAPQLASLKAKQGGKASNETTVIESFLIQWDGKQYKVNDRNQGGARIGEFPTYQSLVNNISQLSKQK